MQTAEPSADRNPENLLKAETNVDKINRERVLQSANYMKMTNKICESQSDSKTS